MKWTIKWHRVKEKGNRYVYNKSSDTAILHKDALTT